VNKKFKITNFEWEFIIWNEPIVKTTDRIDKDSLILSFSLSDTNHLIQWFIDCVINSFVMDSELMINLMMVILFGSILSIFLS
jgi:hypothetical protein